ncbi:AAA family ATPase [Pseudomonas sp. NPDC089918]|uniref:AAA family ATPase n=1 Tax=Pseudomonas sp. NPDC089918 TaxID=3390654 RepID=UPI003D034231
MAQTNGSSSIIALAGVPGTGKSYVATQAAIELTGHELLVKTVQFHPGFSYEDFIEGYRPVAGGFELQDGVLLQVNQQARRDPQNKYVLLIEEFTRANIAAVLGELLTFIEYRNQPFVLPSGRQIALASNLVFIVTYNPLDRSALDLDDAVIRRLRIKNIPPDAQLLDSMISPTTNLEEVFKESLVRNFSELCKYGAEGDSISLPFGHAVFKDITEIGELQALWDQQIKFLVKRPSLPPHPLADEVYRMIRLVADDVSKFKMQEGE